MSVSPSLTNAERSALTGVSTLLRYLSPVPDVDVASARINQSVFSYPLAQITVDTTSGWSSVRAGDTVFIGTSAGASDVGVYRVRLTPGPTTLYIGETSSQDVGELPIAIRTASFADNQYVTVKRRFDLWSVLPTINATTGAIYEDWNLTSGTYNTTPPPLVSVVINNRRNHLATKIADGDTLSVTMTATPTSWPTSSGESFTYAWTIPAAGWSSVSGASSATCTADVDPGNYVIYLSVTGSGSGTTQRALIVHVHDDSTNPAVLISEMPRSDSRDRTGRRMSFDLYNNRLASLPNGAMCLYFEMATWANQWQDSGAALNGAIDDTQTDITVTDGSVFAVDDVLMIAQEQMLITAIAVDVLTVTRGYDGTTAAAQADGSTIYVYAPATDVPTATTQMAGWIQRQDKSGESGLRQATIDLLSPSLILGQLNSTSQIITAVSSPSTWQEVKPALSTSAFLIWYMLKWRCANVLLLFNYTPFSVSAAGQRLPSWVVDKGTVLQQLQLLATERRNVGCDSEGEIYYLNTPNLVAYADRGSIVVRDSVDASIYASVSNPRELLNRVQQVRGEAFSWDGSAVLPTPYYSDAPKVPGQGTAQIKLPAQVVTGQSELNQLTGDRYAQANNPYPSITYTVRKNRDVIEPAQMEFVSVTIPDYLSATGTAFTSNIVPLTVTKAHNPDGTSDLTTTGEGETHNLPGSDVPVPVPNDNVYMPDYTPVPIDPLPAPNLGDVGSVIVPASVPSPQGATVSPGKGAIWVSADGSAIKRTLDISVEPPVVDDVTPSDAFFTAWVMVVHDKSSNFSRAAYALGNNGTDSKIAYTTDIYADTVVWEVGSTLTGVYTQMESAGLASLAGGIVVYQQTSDVWSHTIDLADTLDGFVVSPSGAGAWVPGSGVTTGDYANFRLAQIERTIPATTITSVTMTFDITKGTYEGVTPAITIFLDVVLVASAYPADIPDGTDRTFSWSGVRTGVTSITPGIVTSYDAAPPYSYSGSGLLKRLVITGTGTNPFTGLSAGSSVVSSSTDYGSTWTTRIVGDSPDGAGAFCLSRFGTVALAANDGSLKKATTFGGAFGSVTGGTTTGTYPLAARVPWYRIRSTSGGATNNSTSPDYYLSSAAAISTESLWKIVSGVKSAITPSVSGTKALGALTNGIGTYGANRVCFIGDVSGTRYIFRSTNAGSTWTRVAVSGANSVRAQRFSPSGLVWIAGTATDIRYSTDGGTSWPSRTVSGGAVYVELMG